MTADMFLLDKGKLPFYGKARLYLKVKTWRATFVTYDTASCVVPSSAPKASQPTLSTRWMASGLTS